MKNALLQHRGYRSTHSREEIEEKFGPGGVKGFKGWVASQKSQENARRDRVKNKSGLDSTGKLTRFELLRSQMFSRSDEVNRPHAFESLRVDNSQNHRGSGSSSRERRSTNSPGGRRGENSDGGSRKGRGSEKRARNEPGGGPRNDFVGSSAMEGLDSFDVMNDSGEEFEDPTRWTSSRGKGKATVSEPPRNEPGSSGDVEGGSTAGGSGARDGANELDDDFSVSGAGVVDMTMAEDIDGEDDDSIVEREEFSRDTLTCSPPAPDSASSSRQSRGRRNHVTGVLDEMRTSRVETKKYNDARLKLSEDTSRGQLEASKMIAAAFATMASGNSGAGTSTNGAGTVTTGKEAVERLRSLLETHKDPLLPYVCSGSDFRDALTVATRQKLTREDGEALISLTSEINNDPTIDVEFSVPEILPALFASRS